jgi:hypothetical protein
MISFNFLWLMSIAITQIKVSQVLIAHLLSLENKEYPIAFHGKA